MITSDTRGHTMSRRDTMRRMPIPAKPLPENASPRQVTGAAIKGLINWRGMTIVSAGRASENCSKPTIDRMISGDETVTDGPYQSLAGTLRLPINIFLLMNARDVTAIKKLTIDVDAQEYILGLLEVSGGTPQRRAADG